MAELWIKNISAYKKKQRKNLGIEHSTQYKRFENLGNKLDKKPPNLVKKLERKTLDIKLNKETSRFGIKREEEKPAIKYQIQILPDKGIN